MHINGNQGAAKRVVYVRLGFDGKRKDLSSFHSLTCRSNVSLDCYGVWQTCTVSFTMVRYM